VNEDLMVRFEATFEAWLGRFRESAPTLDMVRYHFGHGETQPKRGKRLRPRMLLQVVREACGDDERFMTDALQASCAIELVHNYSLIHDDIEDGDRLRHGRETVWARYGHAHGINAGDMLCAISYLSLAREGVLSSSKLASRLTEILLDAHYAMCVGQGLDIAFEHRADVSFNEYVAMIDGKTAALFGATCAMGAVVAELSAQHVEAYQDYGRAYGKAFQIRDDILGTWGSVVTTGKPSGADIARRKWCFPVVWALAQEPSTARNRIAQAYAREAPLDQTTVSETIEALELLGAREAADTAANRLLTKAEQMAKAIGIDRERALHHLFEASAARLA
jgi:geranylgeranyl diphosphate synthase type I